MANPPSSQYAAMPFVPTLGPSGGQVPVAAAMLHVQINEAEFNAALERYMGLVQLNIRDTVSTLALELLARIQLKTPVDTGRLRNSFHAVLPGQTDSNFQYRDDFKKTFNDPLRLAAQMDRAQGIYEAIVGTGVLYGPVIEAGHSRKAPSGMVAISVAELTGALDAAVDNLLNAAGQQVP